MGRLTFRLWILGISLSILVPQIFVGESSTKILMFGLIFGIFYVVNSVKSKGKMFFLIIVLILTLLLISINTSNDGVIIRDMDINSTLHESGIRQGDIIKSVNGLAIENSVDFHGRIDSLFSNGGPARLDIETTNQVYTVLLDEKPDIFVVDLKKTNIQTGLDLRGGARALVQADAELSDDDLEELIEVSRNRFNVFGLSDVNIQGVEDLQGEKFMLIEIAGATPDDLESLVGEQGKFEAKIGNETVFIGGEEDVSDVCRNDASCAGIRACFADQGSGGYLCSFDFTIFLNQKAAEKHAEITSKIPLDSSGQYLQERLFLYVDDKEVDSLLIGSSLQGQVTTQISIQGSGNGVTEEEARKDAQAEMNRLQTVLVTGSLPYKLEIVKLDTISPVLGNEFSRLIILAGVSAIFIVSLIVFLRYRKLKASLALLFTAFSELVIILGIAALVKWNLDLPSIAGILATIGTGVDQQIVILDESRSGRSGILADRMKRALFVIMTAYATTFVALIPLWQAGAGLFRGFAFTTIIGITAGVLITRPAFADMIKKMES